MIPQAATTDRPGLTEAEAAGILAREGHNEVLAEHAEGIVTIVRRQLTDAVILVLLAASVLTAAVGDIPDTVVILAVVVLNTALGAAQEVRSGRALMALADLTAPRATVIRDGTPRDVPARNVVRGDLVRLTAGDIVAADGTVQSAHALGVDESVLTGESVPVGKRPGDPVSAGTVVTRGRGDVVVSQVGAGTAMGAIAGSLAAAHPTLTPVQQQLAVLGRRLALAAGVAAVAVAVLNLATGHSLETSVVLAISLAVAAIPESLPAVVALSLAMASARMAKRGVLARKLSAVEALGSVTVIASDKTGTLTEGRMVAAGTWTPDGAGPAELLRAAALCNDAYPDGGHEAGPRDDPTEVALIDAARDAGVDLSAVRAEYPRIAEIPFDAETARMTTTHSTPLGARLVVTKGAPDALLPPLPEAAEAGTAVRRFTAQGRRVLAVTTGEDGAEALLGLVALADPVRADAPDMIAAFRRAGVRPVMITGDHPATALAVADALGIRTGGDPRTGAAEDPASTAVFARVRPEQKTAIVERLQAAGEVVAMTGDGVNDAPALRAADVGIAMGRGTEVAKQAADIVLTTDDLGAMVPAIGEGRRVYDNLRRFLHYALSGGVAEILVMLAGPFLGLPMPLQAGQILWVNLLTHGLPGVAMGNEAAAADVFTRAPRPSGQQLLDRTTGVRVGVLGTVIAAVTLLAGGWSALAGRPAQSTVFVTLTFAQLAAGLALRPRRGDGGGNRMLLAAVGLNIVLSLLAVYWGALQELLRTSSLAVQDLVPAVIAAALAAGVARWQSRAHRVQRPSTLAGRDDHPAQSGPTPPGRGSSRLHA